MKPLNINKESCSPVSSNCVIWQGPDIECIGLCKGATITEVVYELVTQLCGVLETLDVSKYDLTCLNITTCPPETFTELLSLLIERLCEVIATPCPPCEDGANGNYIVTAYEPAGENCEFGGVSITTYNGVTNLPIVGSVVYVCNGEDGNDGQTGSTGGPGTPGQRGDRGLNGNYIVQTEEPAGVNCECGGIKFEVKDGLTDAVVSTEYACTPCTYGAMNAQSQPANLNKVAPDLENGRLCSAGSIQLLSENYDDDNAYNPATGIWVCPETGIYNLSFFISYVRGADDGWFDSGAPGMFQAGIVTPTGCNYYCVNTFTPVVAQKHATIAGTALGMEIPAGTQLCLKVINLTNFDYTSTSGDVARMVIQRIK